MLMCIMFVKQRILYTKICQNCKETLDFGPFGIDVYFQRDLRRASTIFPGAGAKKSQINIQEPNYPALPWPGWKILA